MSGIFQYTPLKFFAQSFWRDEAFTYLLAQNNVFNILLYTARDYNPPLYYLLMHIWMLIFGHSEIAMRTVSLIFYWATLYVAYMIMSECMSISFRRSVVYLSLFFFNPLLIYYAYEARMYTMLAFLSTLSFYALYKENRKMYLWATIAGLYTHYFMVIVVACQALYRLITRGKKTSIPESLNEIAIACGAFFPWIVFVLFQSQQYKEQFWIETPLPQTMVYVPSQLYTGYELGDRFLAHGPKEWVPFMLALSCIILAVIAYGAVQIWRQKTDKYRKIFLMLLVWSLVPSFGLFLLSFFKPLFLTRYIIFANVGLLLLVICSLQQMKRQYMLVALGLLLILSMYYQKYQLKHYAKDNLAATIGEMKNIAGKDDMVYVTDVLQFHVAQYYFNKDNVYIYNKAYDEIPWYVGKILIPQDRITTQLPMYPVKAFVLYEDGHYDVRSGY